MEDSPSTNTSDCVSKNFFSPPNFSFKTDDKHEFPAASYTKARARKTPRRVQEHGRWVVCVLEGWGTG